MRFVTAILCIIGSIYALFLLYYPTQKAKSRLAFVMINEPTGQIPIHHLTFWGPTILESSSTILDPTCCRFGVPVCLVRHLKEIESWFRETYDSTPIGTSILLEELEDKQTQGDDGSHNVKSHSKDLVIHHPSHSSPIQDLRCSCFYHPFLDQSSDINSLLILHLFNFWLKVRILGGSQDSIMWRTTARSDIKGS